MISDYTAQRYGLYLLIVLDECFYIVFIKSFIELVFIILSTNRKYYELIGLTLKK